MIKSVLSDGEIVFILEPGNITKLSQGDPLCVNLKELGVPGHIRIYWTPDVQSLVIDLANEKANSACITTERLDAIVRNALGRKPVNRVTN
jgi:hypothetical protein